MSSNGPGKTGYFGKVLWVDLTSGTVEKQDIPDEYYERYLGGYGLGVRILWDRVKPGCDPLGPDNILGLVPGLFTGTIAPMTGRFLVVGKSPLTGGWGDANCGGYFGPAIKRCGVDGIFFTGTAASPKYLLFDGENAELLDAAEYWGRDAIEVEKALKEKHGRGVQVALIGRAGENLSLISGVVNDRGRLAARSGLGAVMGSKKLKAVVLTGKVKVPLRDSELLKKVTKEYNNRINKKPGFIAKQVPKLAPKLGKIMRLTKMGMSGSASMLLPLYKKYGTTIANALSSESGDSPVKNWGGIGYLDFPQKKARKIGGEVFLKYKKASYGCATCPVRCGALLSVPEVGLEETHRPEYETACMFGTLLLNDDLMTLLEVNELCNAAGIDSISAGSTVGFAIECYEAGILTNEDTGGLELTWGNSKAIKELLEMMIAREGIGDLLADGTKRASEKIGKGSEKFAMHAGGQELPAHDPKYTKSLALTYSVDPTPGRHTKPSTDFAEIGPIEKYVDGLKLPKNRKKDIGAMAESQRLIVGLQSTADSLGYCMFSNLFGRMPIFDILEAVVGWKVDIDWATTTGLRVHNLKLAFSLREGVNPLKVTLPGRAIGDPPFEKGPHKGVTLDLESMKAAFYRVMGWDEVTGLPRDETLEGLDLGFVVGQLPSP
ncbi:MAG: aldehyde ferredoxin oxidoreductase family protein [Promethearchaeota archaeon]